MMAKRTRVCSLCKTAVDPSQTLCTQCLRPLPIEEPARGNCFCCGRPLDPLVLVVLQTLAWGLPLGIFLWATKTPYHLSRGKAVLSGIAIAAGLPHAGKDAARRLLASGIDPSLRRRELRRSEGGGLEAAAGVSGKWPQTG